MISSRIKEAFRHSHEPGVVEIVQAYGAVLQQPTVGIDGSISTSELPFDKSLIKMAIIAAATSDGVSDEHFDALGAGYVELARFQHGGGGENPFADFKADLSSMSEDEVRKTALTMIEKVKQTKEGREDLGEAIDAEMRVLLDEWKLIVENRGVR